MNLVSVFSILSLLIDDPIKITESEKLLYYVESETTLLVPMVEEILGDLKFRGKTEKIFSQVKSLNVLKQGKDIRTTLYKTWGYYDRGQHEGAKEDSNPNIAIDERIAGSFNDFRHLLLIHINDHNPIFEYQLILFKCAVEKEPDQTAKGKKTEKTPMVTYVKPDFNVYRSTSIIIDATKKDYKQELIAGIKSLIRESNDKPVPLLTSASHKIKNDTIYMSASDTLRVEASAIDPDSPMDKMHYFIRMDSSADLNYLVNGDRRAEVVFFKPGVYGIQVKVNDGISEDQPKKYWVKVIEPAQIANMYRYFSRPYKIRSVNHIPIYYSYGHYKTDVYLLDHHDYYRPSSDFGLAIKFKIDDESSFDNLKFEIEGEDRSRQEPVVLDYKDPEDLPKETERKMASRRFNVLLDHDSNIFLVHPPSDLAIPSTFYLKITPYRFGVAGEPQTMSFGFHKFRRISLLAGYEVFPYNGTVDFNLNLGVGYSFFVDQVLRFKVFATAGKYIVQDPLPDKAITTYSQELYAEIPFPRVPVSLMLGLRGNVFERYSDYTKNTDRSLNIYSLAGANLAIPFKVFTVKIFSKWACDPFHYEYIHNQVTFGLAWEMALRVREN